MYELIRLYYEIAIFSKGPQDVPVSRWLLRIMTLVYLVINFLVVMLSVDAYGAILQVIVEVLLVFGFAWGVLILAGKPERFQQTTCAMLGTDALISLIALPAMATLMGQGSVLAFFAVVGFILWHWLVTGYILHHALSKPLIFSLGVAFLYILATYQVMAFLFPDVTHNA